MSRHALRLVSAVAASAVLAVAPLSAQSPDSLIQRLGASPLATDITFPVSRTAPYRIAWGVNEGHAKPDSIVPGFRLPANFLFLADKNGIPKANVHLAVVIWGSATHSLLKNDAYRAAKGTDNASAPLLQALHDAGVEIIVCGEALINRKLDRKDLLPFVKIAPTASLALATLHTRDYLVLMP